MTIDEVKRNLKYTYEKHRNDNIATFGTNISHMAMDCYNAIEQLEKEKTEAYNKALDDLIKKCDRAKFVESDEIALSDIHQGTNSGLSMAIHFAEQLASLAWLNGRNAEKDFHWTFPDGTIVKFNDAVINVTNVGAGDSTAVAPLEFDVMSNGKPDITPAA